MARVLGPQGRRGEVAAELHTSFPERFAERKELSGLARDGSRRELQLEEHWFHKGHVILKFAGVESISDAERLAGLELQIPAEQRAELDASEAYVSDLVGCEVVNRGSLVGTVAEVQFGAGEAPLLVVRRNSAGRDEEFLVPYAEEFLKLANLSGRRIEVELPEGLLELQSPLKDEEKQRQKLEADEARGAGERKRR
ncbi:MAG TPA: ribosome maturation factor RimM [Candidatus Angelobacter sp.]|nr:ribosome maturation factor RimM [Candidatus Angelobacter sp.]